MDKIIFNYLRREAKVLNLNIDDGCLHPAEDLKDHDHELHSSSNYLQYMKAVKIAKTVGFDLFDKKSFEKFVDWIYLKTCAGKRLADTRPEALLNLEKFGLLVHRSSFMDRELPTDNLVEKPIEKKIPEFDESKLGGENFTNYVPCTTTEINKPDESDDFEVVNPKIEELD